MALEVTLSGGATDLVRLSGTTDVELTVDGPDIVTDARFAAVDASLDRRVGNWWRSMKVTR